MSCLESVQTFDTAQDFKEFWRGHLGHRPLANVREDVMFEPADEPFAMLFHPAARVFGIPRTGDHLKAVDSPVGTCSFLRFPIHTWADTFGKQLPGIVAKFSRVFQANIGVSAQGQCFSLPPTRYFKRHHLPPAGATSWNSPRSPNSFTGFAPGFAFLIAVSVRSI